MNLTSANEFRPSSRFSSTENRFDKKKSSVLLNSDLSLAPLFRSEQLHVELLLTRLRRKRDDRFVTQYFECMKTSTDTLEWFVIIWTIDGFVNQSQAVSDRLGCTWKESFRQVVGRISAKNSILRWLMTRHCVHRECWNSRNESRDRGL